MNAPDRIPTNHGDMAVVDLVDMLTYINYATNRDRGMSAEGAATIYPNAQAMEANYQAELKHEREMGMERDDGHAEEYRAENAEIRERQLESGRAG